MKFINLNSKVFFKLRPEGEEYLRKRGLRLTPNDKGYCSMQITDFMDHFGGTNKAFKANPYIHYDVYFEDKDMWEEKEQKEWEDTLEESRKERERLGMA